MAAREMQPIIEPTSKSMGKHTPPDVRVGFVLKVYGIVFFMTCVTCAACSPFMFYHQEAQAWIVGNVWFILFVLFFFLAQNLFHFCMLMEECCGGSNNLTRVYMNMFLTFPVNYLYLSVYAAFTGLLIGIVTLSYTASSVLSVAFLTAVMILALTWYAYHTKADFTGAGAYVFVLLVGLLLLSFLSLFAGVMFPESPWIDRIVGGIGAIVFGFVIVYDTQLIFGEAKDQATSRDSQYTIDMYAFAAFELFLDFVNLFLYLLRALGERDDGGFD